MSTAELENLVANLESVSLNVTAVSVCLNEPVESDIDHACKFIARNEDPRLVLLRERQVIQWLFDDLSFLPPIEKKNKTHDIRNCKVHEDVWGRNMLKNRRPDLKLDGQWTNKFGEHLAEELLILAGKEPRKPEKKVHLQPDLEVEDTIVEVKAETYFTEGTASEKILGTPFKYAEVPLLYNKPLKILCMGGAEKICRDKYGNLPGAHCTTNKQLIIECFKNIGIEYVAATDFLNALIH